MKTRKLSKRVREMWKDPNTVWGKNLPLEKWWYQLSRGWKVVLIYKNGHKTITIKKGLWGSGKIDEFNKNDSIIHILTSSRSQDAYEVHLYPKAKDKTVKEVIANYKRYFKPIDPSPKGDPDLKKVFVI
jgi:hypothetical protein